MYFSFQIRDGSSQANLHLQTCGTSAATTVTSSNKYLWVMFYSNEDVTNTGFTATYSIEYTGMYPTQNRFYILLFSCTNIITHMVYETGRVYHILWYFSTKKKIYFPFIFSLLHCSFIKCSFWTMKE